MKPGLDNPQGYLMKLAPLYVEMFRIAHVIVGNQELAEFVLKKAVYEAYQRRNEWRERMSFHEGLSQTVRMVALSELTSIKTVGYFEGDWMLPQAGELPQDQRQILARLERETPELKRVLMLYYGCGLRVNQIAQVVEKKNSHVRDMLYMVRTRLERSRIKNGGSKHQMEDALEHLILTLIKTDGDDVPDSGILFRAFERDANYQQERRFSYSRVISMALCLIGALICAAAFWLVAVLMEPGTVRSPVDPSVAVESRVQVE